MKHESFRGAARRARKYDAAPESITPPTDEEEVTTPDLEQRRNAWLDEHAGKSNGVPDEEVSRVVPEYAGAPGLTGFKMNADDTPRFGGEQKVRGKRRRTPGATPRVREVEPVETGAREAAKKPRARKERVTPLVFTSDVASPEAGAIAPTVAHFTEAEPSLPKASSHERATLDPLALVKADQARRVTRERLQSVRRKRANEGKQRASLAEHASAMEQITSESLAEIDIDKEIERIRLEAAAHEPEPNSAAEKRAQLKALYELKTKYESAGSARPFSGYQKGTTTFSSRVEGIPQVEVAPTSSSSLAPEKTRIQSFIENARRVNEEARRERESKDSGASIEAPHPVTAAEADERIVMVNPVLSRLSGMKEHLPPSAFTKDADSIVMQNPVLSRIAGVKKSKLPGFAFMEKTSSQSMELEQSRKADQPKKKGRGWRGVLGALGIAFMPHPTHEPAPPQATPAVATMPGITHRTPQATPGEVRRAGDAPPAVVVEKSAPSGREGQGVTPEAGQSRVATIEHAGEGFDSLAHKLRASLHAAYPDQKSAPVLARWIMGMKHSHGLASALRFANDTEGTSARMIKGDRLELNRQGQLIFTRGQRPLLLMQTVRGQVEIVHRYTGPMRANEHAGNAPVAARQTAHARVESIVSSVPTVERTQETKAPVAATATPLPGTVGTNPSSGVGTLKDLLEEPSS